MMLRWLITNYLRQIAHQKVQEAVAGVAQQHAAGEPAARQQMRALRPEIAFVFSTGLEADALLGMLEEKRSARFPQLREHAGRLDGRLVVVAQTGIGPDAAGSGTAELISLHKPDWVVCAGFAAALVEELRRGHIVMADHLVDLDGRRLSLGLKMEPESVQATPGLHVGSLLGVNRLISDPQEKRELGRTTGAIACDMETIAVADACRAAETRCLAIRVISDAIDDRIPQELENVVAQPSLAGKLGAVTGAVLKRPASVAEMWKLRDEGNRLSKRLAKYLGSVARQLDPVQIPRKNETTDDHGTD
jgi:adenosylhomocysteine nucleosidase